jgi:hypothetical protein
MTGVRGQRSEDRWQRFLNAEVGKEGRWEDEKVRRWEDEKVRSYEVGKFR